MADNDEAGRRKGEFLAVLAHELRNPLATLRNGVEALRRGEADGAVRERVLSMMERQLHHMGRLIEDLLDASRIGRDRMELRKERIDLWWPVRAALETSRSLIEEMRHVIVVTLPEHPVMVEGDAVRLTQLFANLLSNAARYTPRGGNIELRGERLGNEAVVAVSDNGVGIASEDIGSLFGMFVQLDGASRSLAGLGIGLALARGLAEMHGGTIDAQSAGRGKGARFTVRLPLAQDAAPAEVAPPREPAQAPRSPMPLRIVLAKRDRVAVAAEARALGSLGHSVRIAHDGEHAVIAVETFRPDAALLDIDLPGIDGYEACRRIRARSRSVVLVALAELMRDHERRMSRAAGFDEHLVGPVAPHALADLLAALHERRQAPRRANGAGH